MTLAARGSMPPIRLPRPLPAPQHQTPSRPFPSGALLMFTPIEVSLNRVARRSVVEEHARRPIPGDDVAFARLESTDQVVSQRPRSECPRSLFGTATVPLLSVPIRLPCTTLVDPSMNRPSILVPEMRFPSPTPLPADHVLRAPDADCGLVPSALVPARIRANDVSLNDIPASSEVAA